MARGRLIDFDDELDGEKRKLQEFYNRLDGLRSEQTEQEGEFERLENDLAEMYAKLGMDDKVRNLLKDDEEGCRLEKAVDIYFASYNPLVIEREISKEIYKKPKLLPSLNRVEYALVVLAGAIACIIDILIVKIPKSVNYLGKFKQEGSGMTSWLRSIGVDAEGKLNPFLAGLEKRCKVPFDAVRHPLASGLGGRSHRLHSLGHDPIFGLVFGIIDILNGQTSLIDAKGKLFVIGTFDPGIKAKVLAPFLWLGHLVSDICTRAGLPIPGWGFSQVLQFGAFGKKGRTVADLSRYMYLQGYDLRHLVTMSINVAVIEIIIRGYFYLSLGTSGENVNAETQHATPQYEQELNNIHNQMKLHKMLFLTHSVAAAGNAVKVIGYHGNPLALNLPQWLLFIKEAITIVKACTRDVTAEQIVRNRRRIDDKWKEILAIDISESMSTDLMVTSKYGQYFKAIKTL